MLKTDYSFVPLDLHFLVHRPGINNVLIVRDRTRGQRKTSADWFLLCRMNIVLLADICDDSNADLRQNFRSADLRFAQLRPSAGLTKLGYKRSQLHFQEWEIALAPIVPPVLD